MCQKNVPKNVPKDVPKNVPKLNTLSIRVYFIADHHKVAANKIRNSRSALFRWCFWAPNESRRSFTYPLVIFPLNRLDCFTSFQFILDVHSTFSTVQLSQLLDHSTFSTVQLLHIVSNSQIKKSGYFHKLPDLTNRYSFQKCKYNSLFIYLSFQLFKN